jgi:hypothetical protein
MKILLSAVFIFFLVFFLSCRSGDTPPRKYLIHKDSLITILVDLHIVYSIQSTLEFKRLSEEFDSIDLYSKVFDKHNVTRAAFDSTIAYYSKHPEDLITIYDGVIMKLTMMQDSLKVDR